MTTTFTPFELFAGEPSEDRRAITVKSGQNLAAGTLVMSDADGKMVAHSGICTNSLTQSGTTPFAATLVSAAIVAGVLAYPVDATLGDTAGAIYEDGDFIADKLVWPATINGVTPTDLLKHKLLEGTEIRATFYPAGAL